MLCSIQSMAGEGETDAPLLWEINKSSKKTASIDGCPSSVSGRSDQAVFYLFLIYFFVCVERENTNEQKRAAKRK